MTINPKQIRDLKQRKTDLNNQMNKHKRMIRKYQDKLSVLHEKID